MSIVNNVEAIINEVGRWNPSDIAYIRRVAFENWDGTSFDLALQVLIQPRPPLSAGWPDLKARFWEADIVFHGVCDLVLTVCGPADIQTPGFGLDDIRNRKWEGQNLLVDRSKGSGLIVVVRFECNES